MADIDKIPDFAGYWDRFFATKFKRGDVVRNYHNKGTMVVQVGDPAIGVGSPVYGDGSIPTAEAKLLHKRLGASRDDSLGVMQWELDWKDRPEPILRLSPDLFEAVDGP